MTRDKPFEVPQFDSPPPQAIGKMMVFAFVALLVIFVGSKAFYQIEPEEVGVVLRLGEYTGTNLLPGLHLQIPLVDKVYKVAIQRQFTQEFGFRSRGLQVSPEVARQDPKTESSMLTGDLNAAAVEWVVQFRIVDPYKFLFRVHNVELTFRDMSEAVVREVVGDRTVNEVITVGRQEITIVAQQKLQELCDKYETGIQVDQLVLQDVTPPEPVKPAFNGVNQAEQEKEKLINEAQSEYNKVVPKARGEAEQTVLAAEGYALERVNRARGEAARFNSVYAEYRKAPEVTRQRIYLETLGKILPSVGQKIVVDEDVRSVLPLLNLGAGAGARVSSPAQGGGGSR